LTLNRGLGALLSHARTTPALERAALAEAWQRQRPSSSLVLATCHRVELYGSDTELTELRAAAPAGVVALQGSDVARHLIRVAVGRDSAMLAEDQILHQLRIATRRARRHGPIAPELDRLLDTALHAGRTARSWLPARRPTLVDVALDRALGDTAGVGQRILVVGTGPMGRAALANLIARGASVTVASRTLAHASAIAEHSRAEALTFDPGPEFLASLTGIVIALGGPWMIGEASAAAIVASAAWIIDVSSPPALDRSLAAALATRLSTIDELAQPGEDSAAGAALLSRLDARVEESVDDYERWANSDALRGAADALATRARNLQVAELERLWRSVPSLDADQRAEVERAVEHLTNSLLRDPLEQLSADRDGRRARAVRELFRL
jgi:glutamyl-tRNA reductase